MDKFTFCVPALFGLEGLISKELTRLGIEEVNAENGRVLFRGTFSDMANANIWLRTGERVLLVMGSFRATTFTELFEGVKALPGVQVYGDFSSWERTAIVTLNIADDDSGAVSDALWEDYGIATRPGAHCAPLMHKALGTVEQGAVRFSFSHFNTEEEINYILETVPQVVSLLRNMSPVWRDLQTGKREYIL